MVVASRHPTANSKKKNLLIQVRRTAANLLQSNIVFILFFILTIAAFPTTYVLSITDNSTSKEEKEGGGGDIIDYLFSNNFFSMTLSTGLFIAAGFIFAKIRGVMKKLSVIETLIEQIKEQKENQGKFQLEVKSSIDSLGGKIEDHKKDVNQKLDTIKTEQYKIKDETHKIIMEYLFDLRKKTSDVR